MPQMDAVVNRMAQDNNFRAILARQEAAMKAMAASFQRTPTEAEWAATVSRLPELILDTPEEVAEIEQ
jgi:hypothetical protein